VDDEVARQIACRALAGRCDRTGEAFLEHTARVAAAVPQLACATAWLHAAAEQGLVTAEELRAQGLTLDELEALHLLTREPLESYELYVLRIATARDEAGRLARIVKLADLDDHIARGAVPSDAPPYAWARRRIAAAHERQLKAEARAWLG
jgi:hypothetical protein